MLKKCSLFLLGAFSIVSCDAKMFKSIDEIISQDGKAQNQLVIQKSNSEDVPFMLKTPVHTTPSMPQNQALKNISIIKDKKGFFKIPWQVLAEYDLKTKKLGKNVKKIIDKKVMVKGFMIPLDYSEKVLEKFLLVPYVPTCSHTPPPPGNMIINVKISKKKGIKLSYFPVEVRGVITLDKAKKVNAYMDQGAYALKASSIKEVKE